MSSKIFRLNIAAIGVTVVCLAIVLLAPSPVVPATTCLVDNNGACLTNKDLSAVPQPVYDDATEVAAGLFGHDQQKQDEFINQLVALYLEARNRDIVIINNSGGFGWSPIENLPYSQEFIRGINAKLNGLGYDTLWLNHYRTAKTLNGFIGEFLFAADLYPAKSEDLADRVQFLTRHIAGVSVILTGESNGSTICKDAVQILKGNPQVYSIQLGPPFWNGAATSERMLVLRSNGTTPDAFSQGDITTILRANLEALLGISQEHPGHILFYIGAPGHDYNWQYEGVSSKVLQFLDDNFNPERP